jgi:hypothetical protein
MRFNYVYEILDRENNIMTSRTFQSDWSAYYKDFILKDAAKDAYIQGFKFPLNLKLKTMARQDVGYYQIEHELVPEFKMRKIA